tara:strand:+ start:4028 stop:4741 length:714 start_codon:yes stop_codon:yes gene_type:complete
MDYLSKPSKDSLKSYQYTFQSCEECRLHKNRKTPISGRGSADASVVILLDKVSARAAYSGNVLDGGEGKTLQQVLRFVAKDYPFIRSKYLWVTPVVICPTQKAGEKKEITPTPSPKEQSSCFPRLSGEIHHIQPEIIIACGSAAFKTVSPSGIGSYEENRGRVIEAYITGDIGKYPIPAMVTYPMSQLYRNPTQNVGGIWNKTIGHFTTAISISETLLRKRESTLWDLAQNEKLNKL